MCLFFETHYTICGHTNFMGFARCNKRRLSPTNPFPSVGICSYQERTTINDAEACPKCVIIAQTHPMVIHASRVAQQRRARKTKKHRPVLSARELMRRLRRPMEIPQRIEREEENEMRISIPLLNISRPLPAFLVAVRALVSRIRQEGQQAPRSLELPSSYPSLPEPNPIPVPSNSNLHEPLDHPDGLRMHPPFPIQLPVPILTPIQIPIPTPTPTPISPSPRPLPRLRIHIPPNPLITTQRRVTNPHSLILVSLQVRAPSHPSLARNHHLEPEIRQTRIYFRKRRRGRRWDVESPP